MKQIIILSMWIIFLFSLLSHAQEDLASEGYCFSSPLQARSAHEKFKIIQVPSDRVSYDENCLTIQMRPHRREIVQRYLLASFPTMQVTFSSAERRRDPCKLKVEKKKVVGTENLSGDANPRELKLEKKSSRREVTDTMIIETLNEFQFTVDQNEIQGNCRYIKPDLYEIKLTVKKNPKPLVPAGLPPGAIIHQPVPPAPDETMALTTELQLSRGQKISIGDVMKEIENKSHQIDSTPSAEVDASGEIKAEKVFLSLE